MNIDEKENEETDESIVKVIPVECPICFICKNDNVELECGHELCPECYYSWFIESRKIECPFCRTNVVRSPMALDIENDVEVSQNIENNRENNQIQFSTSRNSSFKYPGLMFLCSFSTFILWVILSSSLSHHHKHNNDDN